MPNIQEFLLAQLMAVQAQLAAMQIQVAQMISALTLPPEYEDAIAKVCQHPASARMDLTTFLGPTRWKCMIPGCGYEYNEADETQAAERQGEQ